MRDLFGDYLVVFLSRGREARWRLAGLGPKWREPRCLRIRAPLTRCSRTSKDGDQEC